MKLNPYCFPYILEQPPFLLLLANILYRDVQKAFLALFMVHLFSLCSYKYLICKFVLYIQNYCDRVVFVNRLFVSIKKNENDG